VRSVRAQFGRNPQENIVPFVNSENFEQRMNYTRAVSRLNSRVNVAIEWTEEGRSLRAEGFTVDVSAKGCLAVIPQGFTVGQKMRVVNLLNNKASDAVLIWRGHEGRQGWELGIELLNPPDSFWEIDL
jgi:c-di-GMP-binding flagellar brake protein YcgR